MAVTNSSENNDQLITIRIGERFDFSDHGSFRDAYRLYPSNAKYTVEMSATSYMDSSALGMMLLLREHAGGDRADIAIVGCRPEIKKILTISNFQKLFSIR